MFTRVLAKLTDTPQYRPGMQAFDVCYRTPEGDKYTTIITEGRDRVGQEVAEVLFANHPDATDYTMKSYDYLRFQFRAFMGQAMEANLILADLNGDSFIDTTERY